MQRGWEREAEGKGERERERVRVRESKSECECVFFRVFASMSLFLPKLGWERRNVSCYPWIVNVEWRSHVLRIVMSSCDILFPASGYSSHSLSCSFRYSFSFSLLSLHSYLYLLPTVLSSNFFSFTLFSHLHSSLLSFPFSSPLRPFLW